MKRKKFLGGFLLALTGGVSLAFSQVTKRKSANKLEKGIILHSVYFWLKEGLSDEEEADFLKYFEVLQNIAGVRSLNYGKPAPTTIRDVVDHSYSYNLLLTFNNLEAIKIYETHPEHVAGAEKYGKYWTRVEVKDTVILN